MRDHLRSVRICCTRLYPQWRIQRLLLPHHEIWMTMKGTSALYACFCHAQTSWESSLYYTVLGGLAWTSSILDGGSLMHAVFAALRCWRNKWGRSRIDHSPILEKITVPKADCALIRANVFIWFRMSMLVLNNENLHTPPTASSNSESSSTSFHMADNTQKKQKQGECSEESWMIYLPGWGTTKNCASTNHVAVSRCLVADPTSHNSS